MEARRHEAYRPTPQPPAQEVILHRTLASAGPDQAHGSHQRPTIKQSAYTFLDKVKSRFGEGSVEVTSIWNVLGAFGDGRASKKDTLTAIKLALSHHRDLKLALMDVLCHPAADWQADDFDFGSLQPNHIAVANYLQPAHQPQIHLPPIPWHEDRQAYTSQRLNYNQTWPSTLAKSVTDHEQSLAVNYPDVSRHPENHSPQPAFQETLTSETTMPSSPSTLIPVSSDHLVEDMPPPLKKRRCETSQDQVSQHAIDQEGAEAADQTGLPTTNTAQQQSEAKGQKSQNGDRPKLYIHDLCGKGFTARCKVKKHHWGNVLDDLETKNGCWAKYGKPDVSWDDHPSCRKTAKAPNRTRTASPISQTDGESQEKLQMIPPTTPTVHKPPKAIMYTPNMREEYQDTPQSTNLYHSHQLPHRSSFDALLEAANIVSQIELARSQGRTDSVATQLDAQATAAERSGQYTTGWQNDLGGYPSEAVAARGYHYPYTTAGSNFPYPLRGHHVPLEVALPFSGRPQAHTPHMYPTTTGNSIGDPASISNDAYNSRALLPPFSPDPHVRSRRIQNE